MVIFAIPLSKQCSTYVINSTNNMHVYNLGFAWTSGECCGNKQYLRPVVVAKPQIFCRDGEFTMVIPIMNPVCGDIKFPL